MLTMSEEEKNAAEALRKREAEAAAADAAAAIAAAADALDPTPLQPPPVAPQEFIESVSEIMAARQAAGSSVASARPPRPSIERAHHDYLDDLDTVPADEGLELDFPDDPRYQRLKVLMDTRERDQRGIIDNLVKKMDEALEIEHTANETKVAALNAAIEVAENEKRQFKSEAEAKLELQRADFQLGTGTV